MTKTVVLYHGSCYDGFGAAWAARSVLGETVAYLPVKYGDPPPTEARSADHLYILDFSYPRETLIDLWRQNGNVVVLDHHKTAEADLEGLAFCHFDMERSGAMLTWQYFNPVQRAPSIIEFIQDRDLWRFNLPYSREVSAWLASFPMEFAVWDRLADDFDLELIGPEGTALLRLKAQYVDDMCLQAVTGWIGGALVPIVNATVCFSEVADRLCQLYPDAPFAAYYLDRADGKRQWGLRSRGDYDVSEVAKRLGGGGHASAAGFVTDYALQPVGS